jgi:hypothetical protein
VEVRTSAIARVAGQPDLLSCGDDLAGLDQDALEVPVQRL